LDYQHRSLGHLIDCLEQVPSLRDPASRRLCLDLLFSNLGAQLIIDDFPATRAHLIGIVQACRRHHPSALSVFIDTVEQMEPGSLAVRRARAAVEDMTALELVSEPDRRELLALLDDSPADRVAEVAQSAAGRAVELPPVEHPKDLVTLLERMNVGAGGVPPLLVFVELLAAHLGDRRAEQLRRWSDRQAERMSLAKELHAVRLEQDERTTAPANLVAYLVIRIEPDLLDQELFTVVHWRQHDPGSWRPRRGSPFTGNLDTVRVHVADLVADAEASWAKDASTIRVEFLLPYALLNLPVDQWDLEVGSALPRQLGLHYQVVVRSLDRARSPRWHREWKRRWELLKMVSTGPTPREYWLWSDGAKRRQLTVLDAKLAERKEVVSLVLRSVSDNLLGEVVVGVRTGIPVMIWQRTDTARSAFDGEIEAMRDSLAELAENLRLLRSRAKQAARPGSHVGSRVSLLWDDPDRPVEPLDPPKAPIEEVPPDE
jgi:hypothetical protein